MATKDQKPIWAQRAEIRMDAAGITHDDLKGLLGRARQRTKTPVTRGQVGHYFSGRNALTVPQLLALAEHLEMTPGELLDKEPSPMGTSSADIAHVYNALPERIRVTLRLHIDSLYALHSTPPAERSQTEANPRRAEG